MPRPRKGAENADELFYGNDSRGRVLATPAIYKGDRPRRVIAKDGSETIEPGLYPELTGQPCRIVEDRGEGPYPLVLDFNGWRGIARRQSVEVQR